LIHLSYSENSARRRASTMNPADHRLAIGICFSMTTVFRSDVLATVMSRIADLPSLPVVFLRTIIQAVTTYKSLVPFVANNVLPKLVAKKIWTTPQLWDGFVRLAKLIAPASFGVLLQLPKEWLRDVVDRQPALKAGLKGFLASKPQAKSALVEVGLAFDFRLACACAGPLGLS
jgi:symplekin